MRKSIIIGILMFALLAFGVTAASPTITSSKAGILTAFEDTKFEIEIKATDGGNDLIKLEAITIPAGSFFTDKTSTTNVSELKSNFTWTPDDNDFGENKLTFSAKDSANNTATLVVTVDVFPQLCEVGRVGDLDIRDVDVDEDEYFPGETVDFEVEVRNDGSKDLDVEVEAILWHVEEEDELDDDTSDEIEIKDGRRETFDLSVEFSFDEDLDEDDEYFLLIKAFEDEDDHCDWEIEEIDFEREDDDVVIEDIRVNPSVVSPGQTVEFIVDVLNVGKDDQDDVTVELVNSQLGISMESRPSEIERSGDDDDRTDRFNVLIPEDAAPGEYSFKLTVLDEDGDPFDRGDEFVSLTIIGESTVTTGDGELSLSQSTFSADAGGSVTIQANVVNSGTSKGTFLLEVTPVGGWASTSTSIVSVEAGSSKLVDTILNVKSETTSGSYTALMELKSGTETIASETINVVVSERDTGLEPVTGGTVFRPRTSTNNLSIVFWVLGIIALVAINGYFIYLLVKKKGPQ